MNIFKISFIISVPSCEAHMSSELLNLSIIALVSIDDNDQR